MKVLKYIPDKNIICVKKSELWYVNFQTDEELIWKLSKIQIYTFYSISDMACVFFILLNVYVGTTLCTWNIYKHTHQDCKKKKIDQVN